VAMGSTTRRPGRPSGDGAALPGEREILRRGLEAFAELGYDRASARELARRLGVSHTFINDRYGSKAAFWRAVVDAVLGAQLDLLPTVGKGGEEGGDDEALLRRFVTDFYRTSIDEPHLARLIADETSRDTERLDYLYQRYIEPTLAALAPSIERLTASGRMARVPMDVLFFAIIPPVAGMVQGPLARRLGRPANLSHEERLRRADALAALVVDGLLAPRTAR
jgi:TetR/AcrR family transcriptional regulator